MKKAMYNSKLKNEKVKNKKKIGKDMYKLKSKN